MVPFSPPLAFSDGGIVSTASPGQLIVQMGANHSLVRRQVSVLCVILYSMFFVYFFLIRLLSVSVFVFVFFPFRRLPRVDHARGYTFLRARTCFCLRHRLPNTVPTTVTAGRVVLNNRRHVSRRQTGSGCAICPTEDDTQRCGILATAVKEREPGTRARHVRCDQPRTG